MLIISGLDGTASAGIILDSFIAKLFNINHFCVLPALTMQNHNSYYGTQELNLQKQLDCINIEPSVVKIGLLYSAKNIEIVAKYLKQFPNAKIICDTPIVSSSGKNLVHNIAEYIKKFHEALLPMVYLLTPNLNEINYFAPIEKILQSGCQNVLLKGGHSTGTNATDILYSQNAIQEFTLPKIETNGVNIRGTGCCLSTAIACYLRKQHTLQEAIMHAKQFIHQGITNATTVDNKTKILNWNNYELVNS